MQFMNDELLFILDAVVRRIVELRDSKSESSDIGDNIRRRIIDKFRNKITVKDGVKK